MSNATQTGEEPVEQAAPPAPVVDSVTIEVPQAQPDKKDPKVDTTTGEPTGKTFTAADIEKARQEEKDKLYGRIETMQEEVNRIKQEREAREQAEREAREQAEAEARKKAEEEMSVRELLEQERQQWNDRFSSVEQRAAQAEALLEKERQYQQVEQYKAQRLQDEAENLMPELLDLVSGTTPEEIEASIALVKSKTDAIMAQVAANTQSQRQQQRGASVTAPPVGPMDNESTYQTLTAADIAAMDMQTYAQYRDKLLRAQPNERGLFS
jgi:hypothetical protein